MRFLNFIRNCQVAIFVLCVYTSVASGFCYFIIMGDKDGCPYNVWQICDAGDNCVTYMERGRERANTGTTNNTRIRQGRCKTY